MRKQSGFGVMEALVFSAIASVLVLGTSAMLSRNSWQIKLMNVQAARQSLAAILRSQMADPALCTAGLHNRTTSALTDVKTAEVTFTMLGGSTVIQKDVLTPDKQLSIASFRIENLKASGLYGSSNFPIQVGELFLDAQSPEVGSGTIAMKPISLGQVYVESNGPTFLSCFNSDGAHGAAAMACIQFGGVNTTTDQGANSACNTDAFQTAINQQIHDQVNQELNGPYWQYLMGQADGQIAIRSKQTYDLVTSKAGSYRNTSRVNESNTITGDFNGADGRIAAADADRNARVVVLSGQVAQAAATAQQALTTANSAASVASSANQLANQANQTATATDTQARNVWGTANLANSYANSSRDLASNANAYANSAVANANTAYNNGNYANGVAQGALNSANYANYVAGVAANTAQQAVNYGASAYNSANAAYGSASYANSTSSYAINTANGANGNASWAYGTSLQASSLAQQAYYRPAIVNNIGQTQYDCSQMYGTACP